MLCYDSGYLRLTDIGGRDEGFCFGELHVGLDALDRHNDWGVVSFRAYLWMGSAVGFLHLSRYGKLPICSYGSVSTRQRFLRLRRINKLRRTNKFVRLFDVSQSDCDILKSDCNIPFKYSW